MRQEIGNILSDATGSVQMHTKLRSTPKLRNCIVSQHGESSAAVILAQQGEPIDRNWTIAVTACQKMLQIRQHGFLAFGGERAGQRHVKAEILEDVRVSPALGVPELPRRETSRQALAAFRAGQGRPETIEMLHA